jgi:hypothetical protein
MSNENNNSQAQSNGNQNQQSNSNSNNSIQSTPPPPQPKLPAESHDWRAMKSDVDLATISRVVLERVSSNTNSE